MEELPVHVQDVVLTAGMEAVAERHFAGSRLTPFEAEALRDEVADAARQHLHDHYDDLIWRHRLGECE
ncbi:hypothetical protein [Nocardioides pinisoli]|uniref:Uncharacterized protein n=1 Tax=Nocardioides pinisoli TaxID=2950279 RepID=A0ABT1KRP8_9ACTN|nr:hypothetical protein [Nocardioides pinisoli]MCP3420342.1 hypothetical protein [Nocardioides pinisoli]